MYTRVESNSLIYTNHIKSHACSHGDLSRNIIIITRSDENVWTRVTHWTCTGQLTGSTFKFPFWLYDELLFFFLLIVVVINLITLTRRVNFVLEQRFAPRYAVNVYRAVNGSHGDQHTRYRVSVKQKKKKIIKTEVQIQCWTTHHGLSVIVVNDGERHIKLYIYILYLLFCYTHFEHIVFTLLFLGVTLNNILFHRRVTALKSSKTTVVERWLVYEFKLSSLILIKY